LLLLHGLTGSGQEWSGQLESWARHFSVLALDLAGHGRSAAPATSARYALRGTLADLLALLDAYCVGRTHVAGYSMGGRVALAAAHAGCSGALRRRRAGSKVRRRNAAPLAASAHASGRRGYD
jgi:pimeloyl-ACP methyl ester carboxylesterase